MEHAAVVGQLVGEVEGRLLAPLAALLDGYPEPEQARLRLCTRAEQWARQLLVGDPREAASLAVHLVGLLYPSDAQPFDPPPSWWRTPVGRVVAYRLGHPTREAVPYPVAGAMLGVTRQAVHDLVARGKLVRHPEGGVRTESVRDRLTSRPGTTGA